MAERVSEVNRLADIHASRMDRRPLHVRAAEQNFAKGYRFVVDHKAQSARFFAPCGDSLEFPYSRAAETIEMLPAWSHKIVEHGRKRSDPPPPPPEREPVITTTDNKKPKRARVKRHVDPDLAANGKQDEDAVIRITEANELLRKALDDVAVTARAAAKAIVSLEHLAQSQCVGVTINGPEDVRTIAPAVTMSMHASNARELVESILKTCEGQ